MFLTVKPSYYILLTYAIMLAVTSKCNAVNMAWRWYALASAFLVLGYDPIYSII